MQFQEADNALDDGIGNPFEGEFNRIGSKQLLKCPTRVNHLPSRKATSHSFVLSLRNIRQLHVAFCSALVLTKHRVKRLRQLGITRFLDTATVVDYR